MESTELGRISLVPATRQKEESVSEMSLTCLENAWIVHPTGHFWDTYFCQDTFETLSGLFSVH